MSKPCRLCNKPFNPKTVNQQFCCRQHRKQFYAIYKSNSEWFELEWRAWNRNFKDGTTISNLPR